MNWIRERVAAGEALNGVWLASGSAAVAEVAGAAGFDWALIDLEHGLGSLQGLGDQIRALDVQGTPAIVRVPGLDLAAVKYALDLGAAGIMFPQIDTAEDAAEAVRFTRYPPEGRRGMSRQSRAARYGHGFQEYYAESNASVLTVIQIESAEAVRNAGRIAGTDGVDVLFIGHTDLSLQLGCFGDFAHERVQAAEETVLSACRNAHKTAGAILRSSMDADECVTRGFTLLATGTDVGCLRSGFEGMRRVLRSRKEHRPPLGT